MHTSLSGNNVTQTIINILDRLVAFGWKENRLIQNLQATRVVLISDCSAGTLTREYGLLPIMNFGTRYKQLRVVQGISNSLSICGQYRRVAPQRVIFIPTWAPKTLNRLNKMTTRKWKLLQYVTLSRAKFNHPIKNDFASVTYTPTRTSFNRKK